MRKYVFDEDEDGELYIGTTREIRSLYKKLSEKTTMYPVFVDAPILKDDRMYGIHVNLEGQYTVVNASTCLAILCDR